MVATLAQVVTRIAVVQGVTKPEADVLRLLASVNLTAVNAAFIFQAESKAVESVFALPGDTPAPELERQQRLQRALVRHDAALIAQLVGGEIANQLRPAGYGPGLNPRMAARAVLADDVVLAGVIDAGRRPSPFAALSSLQGLRELPGFTPQSGGASVASFTLPICWPGDTRSDATASFSINAREDHQRIGSGLSVYAHLPGFLDEPLAARIAQTLNVRESAGFFGPRFSGSWCVTVFGHSFAVGFVSFYPSAWVDPDAPTRLHGEMSNRMTLVAQSFSQ
jgi:hypothetical protein